MLHRKEYLVFDSLVQRWDVASWNEVRGMFEVAHSSHSLPGNFHYINLPSSPCIECGEIDTHLFGCKTHGLD